VLEHIKERDDIKLRPTLDAFEALAWPRHDVLKLAKTPCLLNGPFIEVDTEDVEPLSSGKSEKFSVRTSYVQQFGTRVGTAQFQTSQKSPVGSPAAGTVSVIAVRVKVEFLVEVRTWILHWA